MSERLPEARVVARSAEMTARAVGAGVLFGLIFGAANAYLGLRVGMTVSTSIPVAIMTVLLVRVTGQRATLHEANLSQTIGSASTSLATGAIFTLPALYLWNTPPSYLQVVLLTLLGGLLGVAAMIPLRELLIVRGAAELTYPEGTACAEVLQVTQGKSAHGGWIFYGLAAGILVKLAVDLSGLVSADLAFALPGLPNAEVALEVAPALLGIGYILGYRQSGVLVSGSVLAAIVLTPVITIFGAQVLAPIAPGTQPIAAMDAGDIWSDYVRYIGAGAVTAAGIATVLRGLPAMAGAFAKIAASIRPRDIRESSGEDLPGWVVFGLVGLVFVAVVAVPQVLGTEVSASQRMVGGAAVAVCGIIFVAVMARIAGIVGTSSQPTSGVTIVTILAVGAIFAVAGWTMTGDKIAVLCVGAIIAVAASSAGDTSQDLKTGHLLGATPFRQQLGQIIGVVTACWVVAGVVLLLGNTFTFGSRELPAPQATLISTLIEGVLSGSLPWELLAVGVGLAIAAMLAGVNGLAFAIGIYLPLSAMLPIFIGGCVRAYVEWRRGGRPAPAIEPGVLFASGLVAGEGLAGVGVALLIGGLDIARAAGMPVSLTNVVAVAVVVGLVALLARAGAAARS